MRSRSDTKDSATNTSLKARLELEHRPCHENRTHFILPKGRLSAVITTDVVVKDLKSRRPDLDDVEIHHHAQDICGNARQLYATLVYLKKEGDICELLGEGVCDKDMPLTTRQDSLNSFELVRKDGLSITTFQRWSHKHLRKFFRVQFPVTAPFFNHLMHYKFDNEAILPFIPLKDEEDIEPKEGGYSTVYARRLHPDHHDFWDGSSEQDDEPLVAVKELYSSVEIEFLKEQTILQQLASKNHPHLIKLLATYEKDKKYYLMFPFANANLRSYWEERPLPKFDQPTVHWALCQMKGIADALKVIHNFRPTIPLLAPDAKEVKVPKNVKLSVHKDEALFGRHGDIKPENLLWFAEEGNQGSLQLADFGLGRFHGRDSRSRDPEHIAASPTYEPPECKLGLPVSREYDMWSLGCLYLEFVTWLLKGFDEIEAFSKFRDRKDPNAMYWSDDNFYTIVPDSDKKEAVVRDKVIEWVDNELHGDRKCSQLIHDLLDLTMTKLLVVDSSARTKGVLLYGKFMQLMEKAEADEDYMLTPVSYHPTHPRTNSTSVLPERPRSYSKNKFVTFDDGLHSNTEPRDAMCEDRETAGPSERSKQKPKHSKTWPPLRPD
ncbi:kinase-like domain-containing protein [Amylocarpus encephaloides]|uniref:Kinase-like domain-containing protein n=1 Tax=Amylocarpus encephaloides TaxID=45428 RepID=A0A9P8C4Q8_9HELO|nr:kinase-like domain-containing protein [Amylocarpus encephaloides]